MLKEFKKFAMRGNIMDLAIGVVIGGAFHSIVNSLVSDIIMPTVSIFTGKIDFSNLKISIGDTAIKYGNFITAIVNFLIIAFSIFLMVKYINKMDKMRSDLEKGITSKIGKKNKKNKVEEPEEIKEPETKICPYCLTEIKYKAVRCPHCTSNVNEKEETTIN